MPRLVIVCLTVALAAVAAGQGRVRCESVDGEYRECYVASGGKIVLLTELSDFLCIQGVTWGTASEGRVWVQRGCRAYFGVGVTTRPSIPPDHVVCESLTGGRSTCATRKFSGVSLVRQLSNLPCDEGGSWGYDPERGEIWVDQGCRGEFRVGAVVDADAKAEPLDAIVVCSSPDGKKHKCPADTSGGVQIFRQLGGSRCRFEKEWGYDRNQIWVRDGCSAEFAVRGRPRAMISAVVCESAPGGRESCRADGKHGVALVRVLGEMPCRLGETWGFDDTSVWVSNGCAAQFAPGGYRLPDGAVPQTAMRLVCASEKGSSSRCEADTRRGVGLVRELGGTTCVLNRTWSYDEDGIMVRDGCSAEFAVARSDP